MSVSDLISLLVVIGSILGGILGFVFWGVRRYIRKVEARIKQLEAENAHLRDTYQGLHADKMRLEADNAHQRREIKRLTDEVEKLQRDLRQAAETSHRLTAENADLKAERRALSVQVGQFNAKMAEKDTLIRELERQREELHRQREAGRTQLEEARAALTRALAELEQAEKRARRSEERASALEKELDRRVTDDDALMAALRKKVRQVNARLEETQHQLTEERDRATRAEAGANQLAEQLKKLNRQFEQLERVWERPVGGMAFQPLSRRQVRIISVVNLKGGVGKTTITAHLAGMMAQEGKKVLAIDADYQRNLSMLFVSDRDRQMLHRARQTLQHFLSSPTPTLSSLLGTASEVDGLANAWIVTNSDALNRSSATTPDLEDIGLEDVEMRLMAEWIFRRVDDVRLRLRTALHDLRLNDRGYDYVLIDCPPRLSTACINALAASDFFLVPVLLDATSARSLPNLLRTLQRLRTPDIFPHLNCLGIVANEVSLRNGKLIAQQAQTWGELPTVCRIAWGDNVYLFSAMVPNSSQIAKGAGRVFGPSNGAHLALGDNEINQVFAALLQEIETRIDHESKRLATVPA